MVAGWHDHDWRHVHRVDLLCREIANLLRCQPSRDQPDASHSQSQGRSGGYDGVSLFIPGSGRSSSNWWPAELGSPASTGAQNNLQYACFPVSRRLAIRQGDQVSVYDTGEHRITGFSQQQSGDQSLTFTSQLGLVRVADLPLVFPQSDQSQSASPSVFRAPSQKPGSAPPTKVVAAPSAAPTPAAPVATEDILKTIERLA